MKKGRRGRVGKEWEGVANEVGGNLGECGVFKFRSREWINVIDGIE